MGGMDAASELRAAPEWQAWGGGGIVFTCSRCDLIVSAGEPLFLCDDFVYCCEECRELGPMHLRAATKASGGKEPRAGGLRRRQSSAQIQELSRRETAALPFGHGSMADEGSTASGLLARGLGVVGMVFADSLLKGAAGGNCPRRAYRACHAGCVRARTEASTMKPGMFLERLAQLLRPASEECLPPASGAGLREAWEGGDEEDSDSFSPLSCTPSQKPCFNRGVSDASTVSRQSTREAWCD